MALVLGWLGGATALMTSEQPLCRPSPSAVCHLPLAYRLTIHPQLDF